MKISIVVFIFVVIVTMLVYNDPSETYWESVGPRWDQLLNPCKYQQCE